MAKRVYFNDVTLRDGHQSCAATSMTTEQCMRVLPIIKDAGYNIFELWGGATLDSAIRFTRDDPWERLEKFRDCLGGGEKIQSLLRGQNLFVHEFCVGGAGVLAIGILTGLVREPPGKDLAVWRSEGVEDIASFLLEDKSRILSCAHKIKVLHVNPQTLKQFEAQSFEDLTANLAQIFKADMSSTHLNELVALWNGETYLKILQ